MCNGINFYKLNAVEVFYCIIRRFGTIKKNFNQKIGIKACVVVVSELLFYLNIKKKEL